MMMPMELIICKNEHFLDGLFPTQAREPAIHITTKPGDIVLVDMRKMNSRKNWNCFKAVVDLFRLIEILFLGIRH